MKDTFENQISNFIACGNDVIGRPSAIIGDFSVQFGTSSGSKLVFEDGCIVENASFNFEQGGAFFSVGSNSSVRGSFLVGSGSSIHIGENTSINSSSLVSVIEGTSIKIGSGCILTGVSISAPEWHSIVDMESGEHLDPVKDINIGDSVWVADGVTIHGGVMIGDGSVIGVDSIVADSVPPRCYAAGMPSEVIKTNVTWQRDLLPTPHLPVEPY